MATTVKLFQFVQNSYHILGIHPLQQSNRFFSRKLFFTFFYWVYTTSFFGYFLLDSSDIGEYGQNFYRSMTILNATIDFSITIWQIPTILQLIEMCEKFIDKSKHEFWLIPPEKKELKVEFFLFFFRMLHRLYKCRIYALTVDIKDQIQRSKRKNRTNLQNNWSYYSESINDCNRGTIFNYDIDLLCLLWFGRGNISGSFYRVNINTIELWKKHGLASNF